MASLDLRLLSWRRQVSDLYSVVRAVPDPQAAHAIWRRGRHELLTGHSESPIPEGDPMRTTGVAYYDYDPRWRYRLELEVAAPGDAGVIRIPTGAGEETVMRLAGRVEVPEPVGESLDVWWLEQYGGGLFIPLRDATAGEETYGGGRYVIDTAKGSDLGGDDRSLVIDFNFAYHPSCRYNPAWQCPLAPAGNTLTARVTAGERL